MKILFVMGDHYLPQYTGGAQSSSHEMALELMQRGHEVAVVARLHRGDLLGWRNRLQRRLSRGRPPTDRTMGYRVYREWEVAPTLADIVEDFGPDIAIVQINEMSLTATLRALSIPTLVYLRNVEMNDLDGDPRGIPGLGYVANSAYTARRYKDVFGIDSVVIPPMFIPDRYRVESRRRNVTFLNPISLKGLDIALATAERCPDIPFCFVESWSLSNEQLAQLNAEMKRLPNVRLRRRTDDMKSVYSDAKIILMPSRWEEAWGRVASEAHYSGIPVVASNRGGLPESVGPGGVLLDPDAPAEHWAEAVRRLWADDDFYQEKSTAALDYSRRPQLDRTYQISTLLDVVESLVGGEAATPPTAGRVEA